MQNHEVCALLGASQKDYVGHVHHRDTAVSSLFQIDGKGPLVEVLTLRHGETSACTSEQLDAIIDLLDLSRGALTPQIRFITSELPGVFSAGGDLGFFANGGELGKFVSPAHSDMQLQCYADKCARIVNAIAWDTRTCNVAVVDGAALGGGFELALACQQVLITDRASLGFPECRYGMFPGMGGTLWAGAARTQKLVDLAVTGDTLIANSVTFRTDFLELFPLHLRVSYVTDVAEHSLTKVLKHPIHPGSLLALAEMRRCAGITPEALEQSIKRWTDVVRTMTEAQRNALRAGARAQRSLITKYRSMQP